MLTQSQMNCNESKGIAKIMVTKLLISYNDSIRFLKISQGSTLTLARWPEASENN